MPLHCGKLRSNDWTPLIEKIVKKLVGWKANLLLTAGRAQLLNAVISLMVLLGRFDRPPIPTQNQPHKHKVPTNNQSADRQSAILSYQQTTMMTVNLRPMTISISELPTDDHSDLYDYRYMIYRYMINRLL